MVGLLVKPVCVIFDTIPVLGALVNPGPVTFFVDKDVSNVRLYV